MATKKTPKKPVKAKTPKGRSTAMNSESRYDDPNEGQREGDGGETILEEHPDAGKPGGPHPGKEPYTDNPALAPPHVSPQGSGAPPAQPRRGYSRSRLNADQQFILILAAIMYTKAGPHTIQEAYQSAKNLTQLLLDEEAEEDEPEPETEEVFTAQD